MNVHCNNRFVPDVARFELVDEKGDRYMRYGVNVMLRFEDNEKTLKIFVEPCENRGPRVTVGTEPVAQR